jgi:hypothetical protein
MYNRNYSQLFYAFLWLGRTIVYLFTERMKRRKDSAT